MGQVQSATPVVQSLSPVQNANLIDVQPATPAATAATAPATPTDTALLVQAVARVMAPVVRLVTPAPAVTVTLPSATALPLSALVDATSVADLDDEANCLATAVYFESKGEPLQGQLAVAQVVLNRAASGRYPASLCGVVKQHAQFSFVRAGNFPSIDVNCAAWRKARAIARIAQQHLVSALPSDVLWYHANYVAPHWRQAMVKVEQIGAHIFYRA